MGRSLFCQTVYVYSFSVILHGVLVSSNGLETCSIKTTQGKCCHFPFIYRGKVYEKCTTKDYDRPWCSTTANYDQDLKWGNCSLRLETCSIKTTQGKCCHFPFIYRGKVYEKCTAKDYDRPWCSTTANYDQDLKWGNCSLRLETCSIKTTQGKCCHFPFIYRGKVYEKCTAKDYDRPWCSTTANYDQDLKWGNCSLRLETCSIKTTQGKCCHFPFIYRGKVYEKCTTKDYDRPWCSTTANYDQDLKWGNCSLRLETCSIKTTQGKCCHFPFIYREKVYEKCTTKDYDRPWCSTTANYDQDLKWGNCSLRLETCSIKTTQGKCCHFPFIYRGKVYEKCTTKDYDRPWCSTTANYDQDLKWGNCSLRLETCSIKTTQGKCCHFPFIYRGKVYEKCTTKDYDRPWCSTTANYDQDLKWGNCSLRLETCSIKTTQGKCCHFPFIYRGKVYEKCTTKDYDRPWCSTTANYDQDLKWGNCSLRLETCSIKTTQGKCCHFPFIYRGKVYKKCTTKDYDRPWCSTTANYDQDLKWGNCSLGLETCSIKTTQGKCCHFPFIYRGKVYENCTTKDYDRPWCSTTANYDQDLKWGNCSLRK
ncbi:uncharacterized protein [Montipora foliosa]|uniref:uncharacterized protein n=1 Tax=Montipora foliosa TaxID=591990 RepID=UPI0035F13475